jgi:hypothetical protein
MRSAVGKSRHGGACRFGSGLPPPDQSTEVGRIHHDSDGQRQQRRSEEDKLQRRHFPRSHFNSPVLIALRIILPKARS